ncbi:MAG: phenylalanine--tRNA ligase subunit alpha, partial [Anaerolineae bacterium]|nr:phenylalanine--tRNA ligase subunit alpha [Anaerolineae bacterium]
MTNSIDEMRELALSALEDIRDRDALAAWRSQYLGRRGAVGKLFGTIGGLPQEQRAAVGQRVNALQQELDAAYAEREELIQAQMLARDLEEGEIDISLPARPQGRGGLHPSTRTHREFQT